MIIICEECETAYNMDESLINDAGSTVRCTKCRHEFVIYPYSATGATDSDCTAADDPLPEDAEDSLGLLATEPILDDFTDETSLSEEKCSFEISTDETQIEPNPEYGNDGLTVDAEDDPETFIDGDLPAIEDLEDFDETFLAEDDQLTVVESTDQHTELMPEAKTTVLADREIDSSQEDVLDLSDIEALIDSGEILVGNQESGVEAPLPEEDEEPELIFGGLFETPTDWKNPVDASDNALETDGSERDPEIEIAFSPESVMDDGEEPDEAASAPYIAPDILFPEQKPVELQAGLFQPDVSGTGSDLEGATPASGKVDSEETAVFADGRTTTEISQPKLPDPAVNWKNRKPILATAAALMLVGAVVFVSLLAGLKASDISRVVRNIPLAGDLFISEKTDPAGNLRIFPLEETLSCEFIDNSSAGTLFVIKGRVQNSYDHPRSHIRITGRLYEKGSRLSRTARVYCGNILSDSELEAMDMEVISRRLNNPAGDGRSNLNIKEGNVVPFMVVFNQLPDNLDEYSIEVTGSSG